VKIYLDTSAIVGLFATDAHGDKIRTFLATEKPYVYISNFAAAEFSSVMSMRVRQYALRLDHARQTLFAFDTWRDSETTILGIDNEDIQRADIFIRRFELKLRAPDALHAALCHRHQLKMISFDTGLASAMKMLTLDVSVPG
jgi:uncharacterized protein